MPSRPTERNKSRFLQAIARGASVKSAASYAGVDRTLPYKWEHRDPDFAARWREARDSRLAQLKDTAFDLALEGNVALIRFLLDRYDRDPRKPIDEPAIGEIQIVMPGSEPDDQQASHEFITAS